jgi:hypothetical protein
VNILLYLSDFKFIPKAVQKLVFDGVGLLLPLNLPASLSLSGLAASASAALWFKCKATPCQIPNF